MKINIATPYCGADCTVWRFKGSRLPHRIVVLAEPYSGAVTRFFGLPLNRIVVTFIYLPYIPLSVITVQVSENMRAPNFSPNKNPMHSRRQT